MNARILIIEDNPANLDLMVYLLQAFGYEVLTAQDGKEGLESAMRERPDLIICDIQMPVMDGYEVVRRLKEDPELVKLPVIAVTAFAMAGDRQKIMTAGFDGYLTKPIEPETFTQEMQALLPSGLSGKTAVSYSETSDSPNPRLQIETILVVDDQPVNLELAASLLGSFGYKVIRAQGMKMALERVRDIAPDLILSDVCMNDGSGYELIQAVKKDSRLSSIPFVFITSTAVSERERTKGLSLGAARFLFRPLESQELLREIQDCLREQFGR